MNQKISAAIQKIAKENHINIDWNNKNTNLKELGIDSLRLMNLVFKVEELLEVTIDDEKLIKIRTLDDLENALWEALSK